MQGSAQALTGLEGSAQMTEKGLTTILIPQLNFRVVSGILFFLAQLIIWYMVSFCGHYIVSVVSHVSWVVNNCFKEHLLLNYWLDFDQTW